MARRICCDAETKQCDRAFDPSSASECRGWCQRTFTVRSSPLVGAEWELVRVFAHGLTYADSHLRFGVAISLQDEVTVRKFFDVKADSGEIAWVLDEGAKIAGILHRVSVSPSEAEIALVVRAEFRRRGIGEFLVRQILFRAARQGFRTIGASIFWNNRAALRLVSKIGFTLREASSWTGEITFDLNRIDASRGGVACEPA